MSRIRTFVVLAGALVLGVALAFGAVQQGAVAQDAEPKRYNVVLSGKFAGDGFSPAGSRGAVGALIQSAGGTVTRDLTGKIGVLTVTSANPAFARTLGASPLVEEVAEDFRWKALPDNQERAAGTVNVDPRGGASARSVPGGGPEEGEDPLESMQWSMQQIRGSQAHSSQAGSRRVEVGILDSGIDGRHADFVVDGKGSNVDCLKGRDFVPEGPGVGNSDPCTDNQFHGTHVAGIVGAQANGLGIVGVAPNVSLIPVKTCDTSGFCYSSSTAAGITYAGDARLEVINMSFFVDDDDFMQSTEFKSLSGNRRGW